jgi:hypothetical protein
MRGAKVTRQPIVKIGRGIDAGGMFDAVGCLMWWHV